MELYRYLDRPLAALSAADRMLARSMRLWVAGARAGRCPCGAIAQALGVARSHDVLAHFTMMMATLDRDGVGTLRFGAADAGRVTDDEAAILALHATALAGDDAAMRRMAASLVAAAATTRLATAASLVAAMLATLPLAAHDQDRP